MNEEKIEQCKKDIEKLQEELKQLEQDFKSGDIFRDKDGTIVVSLKDGDCNWRTYYQRGMGYNILGPESLICIGYKKIGNCFGE